MSSYFKKLRPNSTDDEDAKQIDESTSLENENERSIVLDNENGETSSAKSNHLSNSELPSNSSANFPTECQRSANFRIPHTSGPELANDIGYYIGKDIDDYTKMSLLQHPWTPPKNYNFPFSTRIVKGKSVEHYVGLNHLEYHKDWLVLSDVMNGLFCKFCP